MMRISSFASEDGELPFALHFTNDALRD